MCYVPGSGRRTKYSKPVRNEPMGVPRREPWKETEIKTRVPERKNLQQRAGRPEF